MLELTKVVLRRLSQGLLIIALLGGIVEFGFTGLGSRLQVNLSSFDYTFFAAFIFAIIFAPYAGVLRDDGEKITIDTILRITIGSLLVAFMLIGYFLAFANEAKANSAAAILLSAILATMGWWLSNTVTMRNARAAGDAAASNLRKQHTLNVLFQFRHSETFGRHQANILQRFPFGTAISAEEIPDLIAERKNWKYFEDASAPHYRMSPIESVAHVANFYEAIAAGIKNKDLDELLVKDTLKSIMLGFYDKTHAFILHTQRPDSNGKPTTSSYEHYTALAEKWRS